jgi:hypothetical protein
MRVALYLLVCTALWACSIEPTREHEKIIAAAEQSVKLPPGSGGLRCYERHYALLEGPDATRYFGGVNVPGGQLLVAEYVRGVKPGVYWHRHVKDLPDNTDAGCRVLEFDYVPGDPKWPYQASCSPDIAGYQARTLEPPIHC